jgi:hypothetical protein
MKLSFQFFKCFKRRRRGGWGKAGFSGGDAGFSGLGLTFKFPGMALGKCLGTKIP